MSSSTSSNPAMVLIPTVPHLLWSARTTTLRAAANQRPVHLGLEQVGCGEAGVVIHAVNTEEQHVQVQGADRRGGDGPHQGVRRRALTAGEDHRERGTPLTWKTSAIRTELVTTVRFLAC